MWMNDWAGWLILGLTYLLVFINRDAKKNLKILMVLVFVLSLHHLVALINAYTSISLVAHADAVTFHDAAAEIAVNEYGWNLGIGAHFYRFCLAFFYRYLGTSFLLGEELSILAFLISCFVFIKIYKELGHTKYLPLLLLLYGSLPTMIFIGSLTLRESWQILFFMLSTYYCLINLRTASLRSWLGFLIFACALSLLHEGLMMFAIMLAGLMLVFHAQNLFAHKALQRKSLLMILLTVSTAIVLATALWNIKDKAQEMEVFEAVSGGKALHFVEDFRQKAMRVEARANYGLTIDTATPITFTMTFIPVFTHYMFAPFPWKITNKLDWYAGFESLWRFTLIVFALIAFYQSSGAARRSILFLLLTYLMMSAFWSLGTLNYGTSIRHHLVSYWILLLLFGIALSQLTHQKYRLSLFRKETQEFNNA